MKSYKIAVRLDSSVITPFHSDILWGHICWALRYCYDEQKLTDFLNSYNSSAPPLIISNAFPKGFLPYPVLPPMKKLKVCELAETFWGVEDFAVAVNIIKKLVKTAYVPKELIKNLSAQPISHYLILNAIFNDPMLCPKIVNFLPSGCTVKYRNGKLDCDDYLSSGKKCPVEFRQQISNTTAHRTSIYHAKINRLTGIAIDGGLFTTDETFYGNGDFEIYCKLGDEFSEETLRTCLDYINCSGYGRKSSTGKGRIHCTLESFDDYMTLSSDNAFMTLSNYVPRATDPYNGFYRLFTKYGKLGGHFASSPLIPGNNPMPFKYPLLMFEAGSVFLAENQIAPFYGRILNNVHDIRKPLIAQYGMAYPLPIQVEVDHE
jgi:CRISPR-associated protein Csm4